MVERIIILGGLIIGFFYVSVGHAEDLSRELLQKFHLSQSYYDSGKYTLAKASTESALALANEEVGKKHRFSAVLVQNLAVINKKLGNYDEAEKLFKDALTYKSIQIFDSYEEQQLSIALTLGNLANLYQDQERYHEAESLYKKSISVIKQRLGGDHPNMASNFNNLADLYRKTGRFDQAEKLLKEALARTEEILSANDPGLLVLLINLRTLYTETDRRSEAAMIQNRIDAIQAGGG